MRKQTGNIATLPYAVRQQLKDKLRDNKSLRFVAEWLFSLVDPETQLPIGERWLADIHTDPAVTSDEVAHAGAKDERERALKACVMALCRYRQSPEFHDWLTSDKRSDVVGGMVANLGALAEASTGGNALQEASGFSRLMLSIAGETLEKIAAGTAKPDEVAAFFKHGAKLVQNVTKIEDARLDRDKFKRQTVESVRKAAADPAIQAIINGTGTNDEKTEQLGQALFGEDWNT